MKHLVRENVRLGYVEAGTGDPALIFVHGWCCNHSYFAPQFDHFKSQYRTVAVDLRGYGASDKPEQAYSAEGWADDIAWTTRELGIDRAIVIGHSMGGGVALAAAANHSDVICGAVLCDAAVIPTPRAIEAWKQLADALRGPDYEKVARDFASTLFLSTDDPGRKARILDEMANNEQRMIQAGFAAIAGFDSQEAAKRCTVPVLNIDAAQPIPDLRSFRKLCATLVTGQTVGAGHFHQLEVPEQINAMIERFLATALVVDPSARAPAASHHK